MAKGTHMKDCMRLSSRALLGCFLVATLIGAGAAAQTGEIQSLGWADTEQPTLRIGVAGDAPYEIESLEGASACASNSRTPASEAPSARWARGAM